MTTEDTLQALLSSAPWRVTGKYQRKNIARIVCADGFSLSVQASHSHYCAPRNDFGPWLKVEVGYPSARAEELMPYAEDPDRPTDTVYGYVPIEIVSAVIDAHGGIRP